MDSCVTVINDLVATYSTKTNDFSVYNINVLMLANSHFGQLIDLETWKKEKISIYRPNPVEAIKVQMSAAETDQFPSLITEFKALPNEIAYYSELSLTAIRNFNNGHMKEAVVNRQISIEVFCAYLLKYKYFKDGGDPEVVLEKLKRKGISSMIKSDFPEFLGGSGFLNVEGTPYYLWLENCYLLRNKIIHNGYIPNPADVDLCMSACDTFIHFILHRIKVNKKKYPELIVQSPNKNFTVPEGMEKYFN